MSPAEYGLSRTFGSLSRSVLGRGDPACLGRSGGDPGIDELWLIRKAVRATLSDPDRSWILDAAVGHNVSVRSMLPISAIGRL
jgi:hypothetical protein